MAFSRVKLAFAAAVFITLNGCAVFDKTDPNSVCAEYLTTTENRSSCAFHNSLQCLRFRQDKEVVKDCILRVCKAGYKEDETGQCIVEPSLNV